MKMKRYFAPDARIAIRELREEQGPEAVILSNRRVTGGVEIIAALDYEDALVNKSLGNPYSSGVSSSGVSSSGVSSSGVSSPSVFAPSPGNQNMMKPVPIKKPVHSKPISASKTKSSGKVVVSNSALGTMKNELKGLREIMEAPLMQFVWGEMGRVQPQRASLLKQLMTLGLGSQLCNQITKKIADKGVHHNGWLESLKLLAQLIPIEDHDLMKNGGTVSLVGPTGVGKTTTIAKLAARFALRHGRNSVALVTTDSFRIGAHEQLRTYGKILGIPVQKASNGKELKDVLNKTKHKKLTLIDTAGISQRDVKLSENLAALGVANKHVKNYLVLSATGQMNLLDDVIQSFGKVGLSGCMLTKVDEAASLGEVLSVLIKHNLPLAYVSDGQKVPDHLRLARGELLVKFAVKLMQKTRRTPSEEELAYSFGGMVGQANV